ncbi:GyrI-like domain-containing protein [Aureibaculum sp. 2210JD6-5]|uniref:GyrI-like domain-containing protein n=1 Tax=Aureibaculum sp. 2210JD6-5 TaxID=3103957 RepID=UPI002AACE93C|nr:GyrI-like domain-containing protein [Aureibaculum sp. 2210JD6-5]MDY7394632.1 GyrI-like domain-containing protein [Aureibaculum sp. 2210JD6-5]
MQKPKITTLKEKKLSGMAIQTSLSENRTKDLWQNFISILPHIRDRIGTDFYSVQQYSDPFVPNEFTPLTVFTKWAAVEVSDFSVVPENAKLIIPAGKYAVFIYRGTPDEFHKMASYIYGEWLPKSEYQLDNRPHFEIMTKDYNPNDPNSEEEVWIPIKLKT